MPLASLTDNGASKAEVCTPDPVTILPSALQHIGRDVLLRSKRICTDARKAAFCVLALLPTTSATSVTSSGSTPASSYLVNPYATAPPNNNLFNTTQYTTDDVNNAVNEEAGWFYLLAWNRRGEQIRSGFNNRECLGNLSIALSLVGNLNQAEYSGASGALSLLPTAGALIGSPSKELWIVYKLMPLAGVLSMFLSLGGTIAPSDAGDYDMSKGLRFGGMMRSLQVQDKDAKDRKDARLNHGSQIPRKELPQSTKSDEQKFADKVFHRAQDHRGNSYARAWIGVALQLFLLAAILTTMYFGQLGGVITWWCQVWGWMYFWYFLVIITSVFDNYVAAPFKSSWTMRVSRAPSNINVSPGAPYLVDQDREVNIITRLRQGVSARTQLSKTGNGTSDWSGSCFYVVVSIEGVTGWHAVFTAISKGCTISVFAFGTAIFASSTLMSISAALMLLAVVLSCGVMGRVVAMWIASVMTETSEPMLHKIVKDREQAARYLEEILSRKGLLVEVGGHVLMSGQVIQRRNEWFTAAKYIGLLARPVPVYKLADNAPGYYGEGASSSLLSQGLKPTSEIRESVVSYDRSSSGRDDGISSVV